MTEWTFTAEKHYARTNRGNGRKFRNAHTVIAEEALGKPLPKGAQVHHVDGKKKNNAPSNLVICQDQAYHRLLHRRQRVLAAGGDPETQGICYACKQLTLGTEMVGWKQDGRTQQRCRKCDRAQRTARAEKALVKAANGAVGGLLSAALERETALRVDNEMLAGGAEALRQDLEQERSRNNWLNCDRDGLEKSLAEAQREIARLTAEVDEWAMNALDERLKASDALTAERQKVTALRKKIEARLPMPPLEHGKDVLNPQLRWVLDTMKEVGMSCQQCDDFGWIHSHGVMVDCPSCVLGLTAQPPQDAEPAT